jgi:N12 class adenine-specific DNA methylase
MWESSPEPAARVSASMHQKRVITGASSKGVCKHEPKESARERECERPRAREREKEREIERARQIERGYVRACIDHTHASLTTQHPHEHPHLRGHHTREVTTLGRSPH